MSLWVDHKHVLPSFLHTVFAVHSEVRRFSFAGDDGRATRAIVTCLYNGVQRSSFVVDLVGMLSTIVHAIAVKRGSVGPCFPAIQGFISEFQFVGVASLFRQLDGIFNISRN